MGGIKNSRYLIIWRYLRERREVLLPKMVVRISEFVVDTDLCDSEVGIGFIDVDAHGVGILAVEAVELYPAVGRSSAIKYLMPLAVDAAFNVVPAELSILYFGYHNCVEFLGFAKLDCDPRFFYRRIAVPCGSEIVIGYKIMDVHVVAP